MDTMKIGKNCDYKTSCRFAPGTVIGDNCKIGHNVLTTGACWIGNNVNIRPGAIISKGVIIEDWAFIGPGVVTNHTKHVDWGRDIASKQYITYIGFGCIVGSQASLVAGVRIGENSVVGAGSVVTKDLPSNGVYFGNPCVFKRKMKKTERVELPHKKNMYDTEDIWGYLKSYIPGLVI